MSAQYIYGKIKIALPVIGSAILILSCSSNRGGMEDDRAESIITEQSDTLTIIESENGRKSYRFNAPLMEKYGFAREPYREFRRGIYIETYNDSTGGVESTLRADYAINFENKQLWEAKGNVVATNAQGHILETQQLFWNQRTKKIYSNIDSRVTQGDDVIVGVGFESDETFEVWEFRSPKGRLTVDFEPNRDTTSNSQGASPAPQAGTEATPAPVTANPTATIVQPGSGTARPLRPGNTEPIRRAPLRDPGAGPGITPNSSAVLPEQTVKEATTNIQTQQQLVIREMEEALDKAD